MTDDIAAEVARVIRDWLLKNADNYDPDIGFPTASVDGQFDCLELAAPIAALIREKVEEGIRQARLDVRFELRTEFRRALFELPDVAPQKVAIVLGGVHLRDEFISEGKRLQMEHGTDAVPPRLEQENAAGAWSFMRQGVAAAIRARKEASDE